MDEREFKDLATLVGKRVRLEHDDDEDGVWKYERGYIIHAWFDNELEAVDCYVAFFGNEWPEIGTKPIKKPYVLRYLLASLKECP